MIWLSKKVKKFSVAGYRKYKETDSINIVQVVSEVSSLVGNPVYILNGFLKAWNLIKKNSSENFHRGYIYIYLRHIVYNS